MELYQPDRLRHERLPREPAQDLLVQQLRAALDARGRWRRDVPLGAHLQRGDLLPRLLRVRRRPQQRLHGSVWLCI